MSNFHVKSFNAEFFPNYDSRHFTHLVSLKLYSYVALRKSSERKFKGTMRWKKHFWLDDFTDSES